MNNKFKILKTSHFRLFNSANCCWSQYDYFPRILLVFVGLYMNATLANFERCPPGPRLYKSSDFTKCFRELDHLMLLCIFKKMTKKLSSLKRLQQRRLLHWRYLITHTIATSIIVTIAFLSRKFQRNTLKLLKICQPICPGRRLIQVYKPYMVIKGRMRTYTKKTTSM